MMMVFTINFDFGAGVGREHGVAFLEQKEQVVAFLVQDAVAEGHDLAFLELAAPGRKMPESVRSAASARFTMILSPRDEPSWVKSPVPTRNGRL